MTKRLPVESFSDCYALLDLALKHGGLRVPYASGNKAIVARHRIYRARVRFFESTQNPQYNDIYLQIVYPRPDGSEILQTPGTTLYPEDKAVIVMRLHSERALPEVTDLEGRPLLPSGTSAAAVAQADDDGLLAAAKAVAGRLIE